ncbi:hypothetical protein [Collinsella ihumii]|uniref:Uncharacterized protein n=1 Tax=Collinsella ihumii TaxID=1720204 RepID=A0ABT7XDN8_9ACTN|nr:hypothetical protein [Collinsella ihumii]MDN0063522.1 hypothetical protein [Collinsella ihumii]
MYGYELNFEDMDPTTLDNLQNSALRMLEDANKAERENPASHNHHYDEYMRAVMDIDREKKRRRLGRR